MPSQSTDPLAYFTRLTERRYRPTRFTAGAWSTTEQHISPLNGLVVHAVEQAVGGGADDGKVVSRLTFDILGPVVIEPFDVDVTVVRPGRTVELVEATVTSGSRVVLRAHVWRLARLDTGDVAAGAPEPVPAAACLEPWPMSTVWPGDYIASLDVRRTPGSIPGRTTAWVSTPLELLAGEPVSALARFVSLVDTANGICVRESPEQWLFPNLDLSIHLHRQPVAGPVGLDTTVVFGPDGRGLTSTVLHDELGPVGQAAQVLTLRPRPGRPGAAG